MGTRFLPAFLLVALCTGNAAAQTTTATLQGTVTDASNAVLPGATVTVKNTETGFTRTAITDAKGTYYVPYIPVGRYDVSAELEGFQTQVHRQVQFGIGQEGTLDFALPVAGLTDTVTVTGEAGLVATTKSTVDNVIKREQLDSLPVAGRNASNLAMLAPGVVPRGSTEEPVTSEGQPRGSTEALLDGVSNKLVLINSIRSNAPPDSVEEFQVLTSQYNAEFGNASGLVLNTITRSGTNQLQGRGYYFHRDQGLDARNAFITSKARFEQKQGGGWLGGPVVKDRTHYFASVEVTRRITVATVNAVVEKGDVEQPFSNENALVKITHQINPMNRLTGRFSVDRPLQKNQGVGGLNTTGRGINYQTKDYAYVGTLSTIFGNRALNEVRFQYSDAGIDIQVADPDGFTINRPGSNIGKPANQPQAIPEIRYQFVDNFSYEVGSHRLKFGADISRVISDGYLYQNNPGVFNFTTDRPFNANDLSTYPASFQKNEGDVTFKFTNTSVSLFAQDAWRVSNALTLNLGARYDTYSITGADMQPFNLAPRLGFAWDPFNDRKTSIRGGFGTFYNSIMFNVPIFTSFFANQRTILINNPGFPDPFSRGAAGNVPISTYQAQGNNQPVPRTYNVTLGIQRELAPGLAISADYVNSKGRKLIRIVEKNPTLPPTFVREDPTRGFIRELQPTGYSNYQALWVGVTKRFEARGNFGASYTLSEGKTTNEAENGLFSMDDRNPDDAYGYNNFDERHRLVLNGSVVVPGGVQVGAVAFIRSGRVVNITLGTDPNRNGAFNERPNVAAGVEIGSDAMKDRSSFTVPPAGEFGNLPRNAGRGPGYWQVDVRVSKVFQLQRMRLEVLAEAFNVDNHVNLNNWIGNLLNANYGRSITADIARQVQLGIRLGF
jgi:hypothetical protein